MSEWGPWRMHDGKSSPCIGMYVRVKLHEVDGEHEGFIDETSVNPRNGHASRWIYPKLLNGRVTHYRIRKPKGLTILEQILNDLPAPTKPLQPA